MKMKKIFILCAVLVCFALSIFSYKAFVLNFPIFANQDAQSWVVEAKIRFYPDWKQPVQARIFTPTGSNSLALVNENFISSDYGLTKKIGKETNNRTAVWTKREASGQQVLFYQAIFYELKSSENTVITTKPVAKPIYVPKTVEQGATDQINPLDTAMLELIREARDKSADNGTFVIELIKLLRNAEDDRVAIVTTGLKRAESFAELVSALANAGDIPVRVVNGAVLKQHKRNANFIQWLEVYSHDRWKSIDVENEKIGISENYLPWWYGTQKFVDLKGGRQAAVELSVKYNQEDAVAQARWQTKNAAPWIEYISLFDLPIDTQLMFTIVLMIPIGGLVIVLLRQVIGLKTYGTFMPVLVALSFRETGLIWGIGLFATIIIIGLYLRAYFDRLRLLVVPRLASVLTIVVMVIAVLTMVTYKMGISAGLSITLFPMIILTMMIERMSLTAQEFGSKEARRNAYGTALAATLAYFAMHNILIEHLIFVFPELLFIILACTILLGRYNGYKVSEYFRFKKLAASIAANEGK
jgi:hypothetical protein